MDEHRPAAVVELDRLDPAGLGQLDQGDGLQHSLGRLAEERGVGRLPRSPPRSPHALEERAHGVWRLCLQDPVEVADVDAQLQRGGAHDAGVAAVVEALLRELALFPGHGAVMDEHGDAGAPHVLGDGLRRGPGLAEEQALAARRDPRRVAGELSEAGAVDDEELPRPRLAWRVDDAPGRLRRALHPGEDGLGVAHGRGQPDALDVMPGDARQALEHAHQVGAAVGSRPARGPRR